MFIKTSIAAAAIAATAALGTATTAHADPTFGFSIGFGEVIAPPPPPHHFGGPDPFWDGGYHHRRRHFGWDGAFAEPYAPPVMSYGLSCSSASNVVRAAGFRGVQATDCSRPVYGYEAWKHGDLYRVSVSVSGRIVGVDPIY